MRPRGDRRRADEPGDGAHGVSAVQRGLAQTGGGLLPSVAVREALRGDDPGGGKALLRAPGPEKFLHRPLLVRVFAAAVLSVSPVAFWKGFR